MLDSHKQHSMQRSCRESQIRRQKAGEFTVDQARGVGQRQAGLATGYQAKEKCCRVLHEDKEHSGNQAVFEAND